MARRPSKPSRRLAVVVMAAGRGKRMKSGTPKILHPVCGRPSLWHVLHAVKAIRPDRVALVVSHGRDEVLEAVEGWGLGLPLVPVDQGEPLGTGHAVMVAEEAVRGVADVVVVSGDEPLVTGAQLRDLLRIHRRRKAAATVQTTPSPEARRFGQVVREGDAFVKITEGVDAEALPGTAEVATGMYVFRREELFKALPLVGRDNRQREHYLVDVLGILRDKGERILAHAVDNGGAVGTNSRRELAASAEVMRRRINEELMEAGVTIVDPARTYVDVGVKVGPDTVLEPDTHLQGSTVIGRGCVIGPATRIRDSRIAGDVRVTFSVLQEARVGEGSSVGPYAHLRPGAVLGRRTKAGSFVEIKASRIGDGSKVPHLAYIGDATIGKDVNVGAGTITCNYDGHDKHRTVIGDGAFIGSDTMLVAPVRIGRGAVTGAGSAITRDVPDGALAVERADQRTVKGYAKKRQARRGGRRRT